MADGRPAGTYKIALLTPDPTDSLESEILVFSVDPAAAEGDHVLGEALRVLATKDQPFRISAHIDSARTTESLVMQGQYRDEPYRTKPVTILAARPVLWPIEPGTQPHALIQAPAENGYSMPVLSPDDTKLMVWLNETTMVFDLQTQVGTVIYSGGGGGTDWNPRILP